MASEPTKDASRTTIFGAVSVIVTYVVNLVLPTDMPVEVRGAVLTLVLAGVVYGITWVDSTIHNSKDTKANGLLPF